MRVGDSPGPGAGGQGDSPWGVRAGLHGQGQSHHQKPKTVGQALAGSPCSAFPQPGHRAGQGSAGDIGHLHGARDGPRLARIGPVALLQHCWGRE